MIEGYRQKADYPQVYGGLILASALGIVVLPHLRLAQPRVVGHWYEASRKTRLTTTTIHPTETRAVQVSRSSVNNNKGDTSMQTPTQQGAVLQRPGCRTRPRRMRQ